MSNLNVGYSFMLGVFAALNPCGFAMLPAYLSMFADADRSGDTRSSMRRALTVSAVVTGGFVAVFTVIGFLIRASTSFGVLSSQARWAGLVVGLGMVAAGVAMLAGWQPRFSTARLPRAVGPDRGVRSMFLFGIAYAVASIGCTIGLFLSAILGSFSRQGFAAGVISIGAYGAGMGLLVTALTVTVAVARAGLVGKLRAVSRRLGTISAVTLVLTGAYLAWYWYAAIFRPIETDRVTTTIGGWRDELIVWLTRYDATALVLMLGPVVGVAAIVAIGRRTRRAIRSTHDGDTAEAVRRASVDDSCAEHVDHLARQTHRSSP